MTILCNLRPPPFLYVFLLMSPMMVMTVTSFISDSDALLRVKESLDTKQPLDSWKLNTKPCDDVTRWVGLVCSNGVVNTIRLRSLGLSGKIDVDALSQMQALRTLDLVNNSFEGPIPEFNRLGALKALYLSKNQFTGEIPSDYFLNMVSLKKVWFDSNDFSGPIPTSLTKLPNILELHLDNNRFSGTIPSIEQPTLESLGLANNNLVGEVPPGLARFDASSFEGNSGICGAKFGKTCDNVTLSPPPPAAEPPKTQAEPEDKSKVIAIVLLVVAVIILALMVFGIMLLMKRKRETVQVIEKEQELDGGSIGLTIASVSKKSFGSGRKSMGSSSRKGPNKGVPDLMLLNEDKGTFGLMDLMKAAAEVLGNGALGSSYKAMMSNGVTVVVKRLKDMNKMGKEGFEAEMKRLGGLDHPNILTPLACHYRKEEKLLISEYMPKGSLLYVLHGDRGATHSALDWPARRKIIQGIARGLDYIHTQLSNSDLPHGDLKSSNVLLSEDYEPKLADYGFSTLVNTNQVANTLVGYKAPEAMQNHQVSPKCDVYCLGILILETLTGKFPCQYLSNGKGGTDVVQWVRSAILEGREGELFEPEIAAESNNSEGEMKKLLHVGAACTESNPEERIDLKEAVRRIEKVQVEGGGKEDKPTYHGLPSLRDGYADADANTNVSFLPVDADSNGKSFAFRIS